MSEGMKFTGERFTPECVREIWYEHIHRYVFAAPLVRGKRVLDAACGEGYGSALLAAQARSVTGIDIDSRAVQHASDRYALDNVSFRQGSCLELPFEENCFDRVVSFETLEHLEGQEQMLSEFRRVLKPDGLLLISSPDKAVYTDKLGNENEFHVRELYRAKFERLVLSYFPSCRFFGQKLSFQSIIWPMQAGQGASFCRENAGRLTESSTPQGDPVYNLGLCAASDEHLPDPLPALSLFDDAAESVYEHYYHEIRKNMAAGDLLEEKDREINELKHKLSDAGRPASWWKRLIGRP